MDYINDELISARTGDPLEARLRKSEKFQHRMKFLHKASQAFAKDTSISKKDWKLYDRLEDEWSKYDAAYGEEAYRLGFEDGVQLAAEREIRLKGSVLSVKDMTHLIYMYDAVKHLNKLLLGAWDIHERDSGVLGELDRVCDVIEDGVCAEIRLCGEDKMYEVLTDIIDRSEVPPEERAKRLTEFDGEKQK